MLTRLLLSSLIAAGAVAGQCTTVPNSGCPGAPSIVCSGSVRIGQTLTLSAWPQGLPILRSLLAIGVPTTTPPLQLGPPLVQTCTGATCRFVLTGPGTVWIRGTRGGPATLPIPNQPALVGATLQMQCAIAGGLPGSVCIDLTPAASFTVQP